MENDNDFWNEQRAIRQLQEGIPQALQGTYIRPEATIDPLLLRIDQVCLQIQESQPTRASARSLINPALSQRGEINTQKRALAAELNDLMNAVAAPASLVTEVLRVYGFQPGTQGDSSTRGAMYTPSLLPPAAEVRVVQQAVENQRLPQITIPSDSPLAEILEEWISLLGRLQDLYARMDVLASSETYVMGGGHVEAVDALIEDNPLDETWREEIIEHVLTMHDLQTGEVQVVALKATEMQGHNWIVRFTETGQALPLLGRGEILRLVTMTGSMMDDVPCRDLEFQEGALVVLDVKPEYLESLSRITVADIQQLALLHYGHTF